MKEALIEADGVKWAKDRGWLVYKWSSPGNRGVHDRLHFKNGCTFSIEYKTTGLKATPLQYETAKKLKRAAIPCRCCDSVTDAREFIDLMDNIAGQDDPIFDLILASTDLTSFYI